jgi:hypothetical protein
MKMLIATSVLLSERASDGARHLSISSSTESIIVELSPQLWEKLGNTAKWFFTPNEEPTPAAEAVKEEKDPDAQV